ncbi:multiple coagulation factor deficiency protein 2 homolog [Saccoglossus kowalevskii]|uniref:Multiple coagulation factor deficiency protein 2 homolog n=1 Tax=Saccoglossus kowalevskii TaxID=10224 RepID=A0ABM0GIU0_SACKO|nr:PREDICTED: multiple coagulation factor deficiency protein 2 homolog [Saccoglossus kowalevskii]
MEDTTRIAIVVVAIVMCVLVAEGHSTGTGRMDANNKFHDPSVVRDKEHVKEHLKDVAGEMDESKMSDEELEFHYFKMHDFDNNTKLDGLEMLAALSHMMEHDLEDDGDLANEVKTRMGYYTEIIDKVLEEDDFNNDGYLTYLEYVVARRRDEKSQQKNADL